MTIDKIVLDELDMHIMRWYVQNNPEAKNLEIAERLEEFASRLRELEAPND